MAAFRGRLFCNTICPVGTFFSILSRFSIYKIQIVKSVCSMCGRCSSVCKSECIDIKNQKIDFDRCVVCLNCINTCPEKGIKFVSMVKLAKLKYQSKKERKFDSSKRTFITGIIGTLIGANIVGKLKAYDQKKDKKQNLIPIVKNKPVTPPGSLSLEHYKTSCTACHLCVSICPTHVLSPSFLEYGLTGMLIPYMNYDKSFCNYECNKCSQVCPTGAIIPITSNQKKIIQIGKVVFIRENCIVYNEETSCGACAEHCPTSAVHMVPYRGFLTIPETNQEICIGCGACEYACPAQPHKAIYVEANKVHEEAKLPDEGKPQEGTPKYFPF